MNNFSPKSFNSQINDFNSTFPENRISMKNQTKNQNFELINNKENVKNYSNIPSESHQILLGSLLGDMYLRRECKNSNIEETHSIKQKGYLNWKYKLLSDFFDLKLYDFDNPVCKAKGRTYIRKTEVRLRSKVSDKLNLYHDLFYEDGVKKISLSLLNQLDTLALAVWYCDDGSYDYQDRHIMLHTEGFSYKENLLLRKWFKNKWDLDNSFKKAHSGQVGLRFDVKNSDKFLELVKNHILELPESIRYKLGHLWDGNIRKLDEAKIRKKQRMRQYESREEVKIRRNQKAKEHYHKNKEQSLKRAAEFRKTQKYRDYIKKYHQRPETKERVNKYNKEYRKKPEVKAKIKEYNKRIREKQRRSDKN